MQVKFLELAEQELNDSVEYYENQQENLGVRFKGQIYQSLLRIQRFPKMYIKIRNDVRKCIVNKFPFNILYSIEEDHIVVIAISHHHRNPDYWIDRIK